MVEFHSGLGNPGVEIPLLSVTTPVETNSGSRDPGVKTPPSFVAAPVHCIVESDSGLGDPGVKTPPLTPTSPVSLEVESFPVSSSVVSRQVSAVVPSLSCRAPPVRSALDPRVPPFCPRMDFSAASGAPHCCARSTQPLRSIVCPVIDPDDTLCKTSLSTGSIFSVASDVSVPPHLQELFDKTVNESKLCLSHQQSLATVLRRNGGVCYRSCGPGVLCCTTA